MQKLILGATDLSCLAREVLQRGGIISFRASGTSMQPTLLEGDLLTAVAEVSAGLRPGDLVLYSEPDNRAAVHRISDVSGLSSTGEIQICSDFCPGESYSISASRIIGRIVSASRNGKEVPIGFAAPPEKKWFKILFHGVGRLPRHILVSILSGSSNLKPCRKILSICLQPLVRYEVLPSRTISREGNEYCTWELLQASILGFPAGSAQLVRFHPGTPFGDIPWLFSMRVRRPFRGGGIGRGLTSSAIGRVESSGERAVGLLVEKTNLRAFRLYESMGFRITFQSDISQALRESTDSSKEVMLKTLTHGSEEETDV